MLFTKLFGFYPFTKPNIANPICKLFVEEEYCTFLAKFEHIKQCSENYKGLFNRMVCFVPKEIINLDEIKNHPWLIEDDKDNCLLIVDEKKRNIGVTLEKNKKMCENK